LIEGVRRERLAQQQRPAAAGKCFLDMLGVFAEFETNLRRERQLEGIARAKTEGVYKGRPASIDVAQVRAM
jgi:DNA invertase Pin-like site-specific DNA recombinase